MLRLYHLFCSSVFPVYLVFYIFFSSIRRHTIYWRDWSSDVCSSDLVAACDRGARGGGDGGDGEGPFADKVRESIPLIERATGLRFKSPPKLEVRTKAQVREFLVRKFEEQQPAQEIASEEIVYKTLGLIPQSLDLRRFLLDLYTEQIVGFYDPSKKVL